MSSQRAVKIWLILSTLASAGGWVLSAMGQLNAAGYIICALLAAPVIWFGANGRDMLKLPLPRRDKMCRRFRRRFPFLFLLLAVLILAGGLLYAPNNYDALTYRIPRVLHWLAERHWYWVHTPNYRLNNRSSGFEWLMSPLLLVTRSDRSLFLINFISYLLLPGLIFSVFTRMGVGRRTAWNWMWLLPAGCNFALQAGGAANDTFAAVYALAAVDFALRARTSQRMSDVGFSILAAALLTGSKAINLPLLLPWAIALLPVLGLVRRHLSVAALVGALGLLVSLLPTAILNIRYCGDWTGLNLEAPGIQLHHPLVGIIGQSAFMVIGNFVPPVFPFAGTWNSHFLSALPAGLAGIVQANFEAGNYSVLELPGEEAAGLGLMLSLLLMLSGWATFRSLVLKHVPTRDKSISLFYWVLWTSPFIALLVLFSRTGISNIARVTSAYYPLLVPLLVAGPAMETLVRSRLWRILASLAFLTAIFVVVMTPARPLWPAGWILPRIQTALPQSATVQRAATVYRVYSHRSDLYAAARAALPEDVRVIGFWGTLDDTDVSFWRPYGQRRVVQIMPGDDLSSLKRQGVQWLFVNESCVQLTTDDLAGWPARNGLQLVATFSITAKVHQGEQRWLLLKFVSPDAPSPGRAK